MDNGEIMSLIVLDTDNKDVIQFYLFNLIYVL